jgi:hypothetical protein
MLYQLSYCRKILRNITEFFITPLLERRGAQRAGWLLPKKYLRIKQTPPAFGYLPLTGEELFQN